MQHHTLWLGRVADLLTTQSSLSKARPPERHYSGYTAALKRSQGQRALEVRQRAKLRALQLD